MELAGHHFSDVLATFFGPSQRLFPAYILAMVALCMILHWRRGITGSFFGWLFPKSTYLHPSHIVDVKLFVVNRAIAWLGFLNLIAVGAVIASGLAQNVSIGVPIEPFHPFVITMLLLLVADFATYWVHRLHHENRVFWPFHALHHSAQVMTPITLYRKHPVYDLISSLIKGVLIGALQGGLLVLFDQQPGILTIAGANLFYVAFNLFGSNLRHSHVWLSYGRALEHVFVSPAQHQIHHSIAPQHHDKNYGEVLAIWDWMFGTLYIPDGVEKIEFGLADRSGRPLPQRHTSLRRALTVPFAQSVKAFSGEKRADEDSLGNDPTDPTTVAEQR